MTAEPRFGERYRRLSALWSRGDANDGSDSRTAESGQSPAETPGQDTGGRHARKSGERRGRGLHRHSVGATTPTPRHPLIAADVSGPSAAEVDRRRAALRLWANRHGLVHEVRPADPHRLQTALDALGNGDGGRYLLEFEDGSCYVDRSDKIPGQLRRHLTTHADIVGIRFISDSAAPAPPLDELVAFEIDYADTEIENHLARRLDAESSANGRPNNLSGVVGTGLQEQWYEHPDLVNRDDLDGERRIDPTNPVFAAATADLGRMRATYGPVTDTTIAFLAGYLRYCLPFPLRTEYDFWTLAGLPGETRSRGTVEVVASLSIGWTEAITVVIDSAGGSIEGTLLIDGSELIGNPPDPADAAYLRLNHPLVRQAAVPHHSARSSSLLLRSDDPGALIRLLDDTAITRAAATAALHLMRGRPAPPTRRSVHSPRLVTDILNAFD